MTKARDIATSSVTTADLTAEVGSTIQAHDADLDTISGLAKTDGNVIVGDGTNWVAEDPATVRTSLGLGTAATTAATDYATAAQGATADSALQANETITLSGDVTGSGTTAITASIAANSVGTDELNVSGTGTSGQLLSSDGDGSMSWAAAAAGGFSNMQAFTSPGTWTNPGSVTKVKVTVVGGGGGGANDYANNTTSGGGGGGGAAIEVLTIPTSPVAVTRGAGGGIASSGGTSSFGAYCSATGGSGANGSNGDSGAGGQGSGGTFNAKGQGGGTGIAPASTAANLQGGTGGSSIFGGGGRGAKVPSPGPHNADAGVLGGGGGGGGRGSSIVSGGSGGAGIVIVEW